MNCAIEQARFAAIRTELAVVCALQASTNCRRCDVPHDVRAPTPGFSDFAFSAAPATRDACDDNVDNVPGRLAALQDTNDDELPAHFQSLDPMPARCRAGLTWLLGMGAR